jgi:leader peptidase (prepilin peptidase)/N-methyltransferase
MQSVDLFVHSNLFYLLVFMVGACVGSFSCVCITRIPKGESIIFPRSHCVCGKIIPAWLNIPIISWLILRAKARCCGAGISVGYFAIEVLVAVLFTILWHVTQSALFVVGSILFVILVIALGIDFDRMMIPDSLTVGGTMVGIIVSGLLPWFVSSGGVFCGVLESVKGLLIGSSLLLWIAIISEFILKKETIGFGDVKLMGCIGAFSGTNCAIFSIFGGAVIGLVTLFPIWAIHCKLNNKPLGMGCQLPFGPFLALGAISYWLFFKEAVDSSFSEMMMLLSQV